MNQLLKLKGGTSKEPSTQDNKEVQLEVRAKTEQGKEEDKQEPTVTVDPAVMDATDDMSENENVENENWAEYHETGETGDLDGYDTVELTENNCCYGEGNYGEHSESIDSTMATTSRRSTAATPRGRSVTSTPRERRMTEAEKVEVLQLQEDAEKQEEQVPEKDETQQRTQQTKRRSVMKRLSTIVWQEMMQEDTNYSVLTKESNASSLGTLESGVSLASEISLSLEVEENDKVADRVYEGLCKEAEETLVAPGFAVFLYNLTNVFYFRPAYSSAFLVQAALVQLIIQTFFNIITVTILNKQAVAVEGAGNRRPIQLLAVKVLIAFIATQYTLFTYETHVSTIPKL